MFELFSQFHFSSDAITALDDILMVVKHLMTLFGSLVILTGSLFVIGQFLFRLIRNRRQILLYFDSARLGLTRSIILGLEFIIAADVIQTTRTPDYYAVGILAAIALIRAFLNFSLNKDLNALSLRQQQEEFQDH